MNYCVAQHYILLRFEGNNRSGKRHNITLYVIFLTCFNPINAELNPICHLLALLGAHHILHLSRIRVNVSFSLQGAECSLKIQSSLKNKSLKGLQCIYISQIKFARYVFWIKEPSAVFNENSLKSSPT